MEKQTVIILTTDNSGGISSAAQTKFTGYLMTEEEFKKYETLKSDFLLAVDRIVELKKEVEDAENVGYNKAIESVRDNGL